MTDPRRPDPLDRDPELARLRRRARVAPIGQRTAAHREHVQAVAERLRRAARRQREAGDDGAAHT